MKKTWIYPLIVISCFVLAGIIILFNLPTLNHKSIYTNDRFVAQKADSYSTYGWSGNRPAENQYILNVDEFNGSSSILLLTVEDDNADFTIEYDLTITAGDFKIVLVEYSENVWIISDETAKGTKTFTLEPGDYGIKVVGKNAEAEVALQFHADSHISVQIPQHSRGTIP